MNEPYWITDPRGHREVWNREAYGEHELLSEEEKKSHFIFTAPPDDWVCDMCNATLDHTEGIPCIGSRAYCLDCFEPHGDVNKIKLICSCEPCFLAWCKLADALTGGTS